MLSWDIKVPIFKNHFIVKQLGIAIGVPFGLLSVFLLIIRAYYGLIIIALLILLTYLFVLLIFKGTYDVKFVVSEKGVLCENQPRQQKRVKTLSFITFILGLFSRNTTAAGAGMLAGSRTKVFLPWKRLRKVKYLDRQNSILLYGGFGENIALFCTEENYNDIRKVVAEKMNKNRKRTN